MVSPGDLADIQSKLDEFSFWVFNVLVPFLSVLFTAIWFLIRHIWNLHTTEDNRKHMENEREHVLITHKVDQFIKTQNDTLKKVVEDQNDQKNSISIIETIQREQKEDMKEVRGGFIRYRNPG